MAFSDISFKKVFVSLLALSAGAPAAAFTQEPRRAGAGLQHDVFTRDSSGYRGQRIAQPENYPDTGVAKTLRAYRLREAQKLAASPDAGKR